MSQFLPQEKIAEIQQSSDIVSVISEYVALKNAGKNYVGLCPFHNEKTPSFTVNPERQYYKCFGCGESGNVFAFLMRHNGIKFSDAARALAGRANIVIPKDLNSRGTSDQNKLLYTINCHFAKFYHKIFMGDDLAKQARRYISDRGINEDSVEKFVIGYSHSSWDSSLQEAEAQKFKIETLESAGIVLRRENRSGFYDRFRGRLMFPIFSEAGNIAGFGARTLEDSQPKYINSPESKIFNKRRVLYGLNLAKDAIIKRKEVIIMEGYTDVIMAHQHGIDWAVGVMGTSLTNDHVRLVNRYCRQVVLVLDADAAGIKSADKSAGLFIEEGFDVKIVQLPEEYDPCEFLVSNGKEAFLSQMENASDFFGFKLKIAQLRGELDTVSGKTKVFNDIILTAIKIPDILKRNIQIKEIAEKIKIDESEIRKHLNKRNEKGSKSLYSRQENQYQSGKPDSSNLRRQNASYRIETNLIRLMLLDNKFIPLMKNDIGFDNFLNERLRCITKTIFETYNNGGSATEMEVFSIITDPEQHQVLADIMNIGPLYGDSEAIFKECKQYFNKQLSKHEIKKTKERTREMENELKNGHETDDGRESNVLLYKFHNENKRLQSFKKSKKKMSALKKRMNVFV